MHMYAAIQTLKAKIRLTIYSVHLSSLRPACVYCVPAYINPIYIHYEGLGYICIYTNTMK